MQLAVVAVPVPFLHDWPSVGLCHTGCSLYSRVSPQVRIDHSSRTLSFGSDLNYSAREDAPVGPYLQNMPSEHIRNQLTAMSTVLSKAVSAIKPAHIVVSAYSRPGIGFLTSLLSISIPSGLEEANLW